jgi:hypothetical protein
MITIEGLTKNGPTMAVNDVTFTAAVDVANRVQIAIVVHDAHRS